MKLMTDGSYRKELVECRNECKQDMVRGLKFEVNGWKVEIKYGDGRFYAEVEIEGDKVSTEKSITLSECIKGVIKWTKKHADEDLTKITVYESEEYRREFLVTKDDASDLVVRLGNGEAVAEFYCHCRNEIITLNLNNVVEVRQGGSE